MLIMLFVTVFAATFALEVQQAGPPPTSTTVGLRHGSLLR